MSDIVPVEYCEETINLKKTLESGFILLGERLSTIKREQLWSSQWDSFANFCREMDINEATASRLITVYSVYVEKYQMTQAELSGRSWYNLYELRKAIPEGAGKKDVKDLVETISDYSRQDIKDMLREREHGVCKHLNSYEIRIKQCRDCGHRESIE